MESREGKGFADQGRWNEYGMERLREIERNPGAHIISECPIRHIEAYERIIEVLSPIAGKKIVELGCGKGDFAVWLKKRGADVTGIDLGQELVAAASLLARVNKVAIEFRHGSITELPFKSAAYDVVVGIAILHHLSEAGVVEVLRECHRILRDGGIAVFVEPVENSKIFNFMQNLFPVRGGGYRPSILQRKAWARYKETRDDRAMSNLELIRAGEELFRSISISPYGCLVRLARFFGAESREILLRVDRLIFRVFPPLRHYCQTVLVEYRK